MPTKQGTVWKCDYCNFTVPIEFSAYAHERNEHGLMLVPLLASDVQSILQFIYTKDDRLINKRMLDTLKKALKVHVEYEKKRNITD